MRLLHTTSLKLESFRSSNIPPYAILSHTWSENDDDEVNLQDFRDLETAHKKIGFRKISETCLLARERKIDYAWIDTCCIDKSSTAELTESINSMYQWYQRSALCIAFINDWLPDVDWADIASLCEKQVYATPPLRWFTRGWTLQELIAPQHVNFYDGTWNARGCKTDRAIAPQLARITGIHFNILMYGRGSVLREVSVGQKMSWASHRVTSRVEDTAYCLLGIFEVNMPLLYGEGEKAFLRLQDEIIKLSTDLSLFAWEQGILDPRKNRGAYAAHPSEFASSRHCRHIETHGNQVDEFSMTNKGLKIHTALWNLPTSRTFMGHTVDGTDLAFLPLRCVFSRIPLAILLQRVGLDTYVRVTANMCVEITHEMGSCEPQTIYVRRDVDKIMNECYERDSKAGIKVLMSTLPVFYLQQTSSWPPGIFDRITSTIMPTNLPELCGHLKFHVLAEGAAKVLDEVDVYYWGMKGVFEARFVREHERQRFRRLFQDAKPLSRATINNIFGKMPFHILDYCLDYDDEIFILDGMVRLRLLKSEAFQGGHFSYSQSSIENPDQQQGSMKIQIRATESLVEFARHQVGPRSDNLSKKLLAFNNPQTLKEIETSFANLELPCGFAGDN